MNVQERIRISLILEEMNKNKDATRKFGLKDISEFKFEVCDKSDTANLQGTGGDKYEFS